MRVIKQNTLRYESFYKSLPSISSVETREGKNLYEFSSRFSSDKEKEKQYFDELLSLQNDLIDLAEIRGIAERFESALRRIIPLKEINIFLFDDSESKLVPLLQNVSNHTSEFINKSYKEGILDWIFETRFAKVIPDLDQYNISGSKLYYLIFPVISENSKKGILTILTSINKLQEKSFENNTIRLMLDLTYSRIGLIKIKKELTEAYNDQQVYQSKLINDYKLSAVGELTNGIVEDIISPLQVIMSHIDLLKKERTRLTNNSTAVIKNQVSKIEQIVKRLVKFASVNNDNIKIHPCNLNNSVEEFFTLFSSTLESNGYEYHLDIQENLPMVLSHPNYIYQLLTNVFSVINSNAGDGGGILIQTRYRNEKVTVRFAVTEIIEAIKNKNDISQFNLRIINNIMKKHEGEFKVGTNHENGTIILLSFPLKRKIRT